MSKTIKCNDLRTLQLKCNSKQRQDIKILRIQRTCLIFKLINSANIILILELKPVIHCTAFTLAKGPTNTHLHLAFQCNVNVNK